MKNSLLGLLPAFLLAACAATPDSTDAETSVAETEQELGTAGLQRQVYRGQMDADGQRFSVELELATRRAMPQRKYCHRYDDGRITTGASVTAGHERPAGKITVRVRDAVGRVVSEQDREFYGLSIYESTHLDPAFECTRDARIASRAPIGELSQLIMNTTIPGLVAKLPGGDVWVNPSYGGPGVSYLSFTGVGRFSTTATGVILPRPIGHGEEISFGYGLLSLDTQPEITLEVGWDVAQGHAKKTAYVVLRK